MATAAVALGYGALAAGGIKNVHEAYRDARRKLSAVESLAWAIANAGAIIAGGFAGRAVAHMGINAYNHYHQENTALQERTSHQESREFTENAEHTKNVTDYPEEAVPRAEAAMEKWYANDPELLQQRVEAIEAYNAAHGTDINPYRALRVMALAGSDPSHLSYTDAWAGQHGYTPEQINAMANVFEPGSAVMTNPEGMDLVRHFDLTNLDAKGHIGGVDGHVLQPRDVYSDLGDMPTQHTETYTAQETVTKTVDVDDYNSVNKNGMAMFGTYNPREKFKKLKSRIGSFMDRVTGRDDSPVSQEPVVVVKNEEKQVQTDAPDTDTINFVPVSDEEILEDLYYPSDAVEDTDEAEVVHPQDEEAIIVEEPENNSVVDVPADEDIEVIRPQDEAVIEDLQPVIEEENVETVQPQTKEEILGDIISAVAANAGVREQKKTEPIQPKEEFIEEASVDILPPDLQEPMDEEIVEEAQPVIEEENIETVQPQTKEEILGDIISAVAANARAREQKETEPVQAQEEVIEEVVPEIVEPVSAPAKPKDELENINWAQYQHPFTFDYEKIETENPFDIRKEMNLSDNTVRHIDVGALLKKSESESTVQQPTPEPVAEVPQEPVPEAAPEVVPEQTPVAKPASESLFESNARTDMLDVAYGKSIIPNEERNYSVPAALEKLAQQEDIMETDVGSFHGTPVKFVDINGNDSPIARSKDNAVVIVEVGELKIPFYLATGLNGGDRDIPGHWYPASRISADGTFYRPRGLPHNSNLLEIGSMLDDKIGDIRNWEDNELTRVYKASGHKGSIGGFDAAPKVNTDRVYKMLANLVYMQPGKYYNYSVYGTTPESRELAWEDGMISYILRDMSETYENPASKAREGVRTLVKGIRSRFQKVFGSKH